MSFELLSSLFLFLGGIGMFVYGMQIMSSGLLQAAGERTRHLLEVLTGKRWMALIVGAAVTALIQSSGATTVMVIGFVNAQLMNLNQAVGVIMGANIGTTMTAWLVSLNEWGAILKPEFIAPLLLITGVVIQMISKRERLREGANILIGFGLLFIGLTSMSNAVTPYADSPFFADLFAFIGGSPVLGLIIGALVTAIMQSSSASMGILQVLALNGIVNWGSAVFISLGQNIGTCVVALISAIGADANAKRAALLHLEFNVFGAVLVGTLALIYFALNSAAMTMPVTSTGLAIFHTAFNLGTALVLYPFANGLVKISKLLVKSKEAPAPAVVHLDDRLLKTPFVAIDTVEQEMQYMGGIALQNIAYSRDCLLDNQNYEQLTKNADTLKMFYDELSRFLELLNTTGLNEKEQMRVKHAVLALRDLRRISERCQEIANISARYIDYKDFSEPTRQELNSISSECYRALELALDLKSTPDPRLLEKVKQYEAQVDRLQQYMREGRLNKLLDKKSSVANSVVFLEAVDNYKRIADHARLLAHYIALEEGYEPLSPSAS